jgi:hypothetical protein
MTQPFSPAPPPPWQRRLFERAKAIILRPRATWAVIDGEATPLRDLYVHYAMPLAVIGPVAGFLGGQIFGRGQGVLGTVYRPSFFNALFAGVLQYVFALISVAVLALVINALARQFGAAANQAQAFKLAIYGSTAAWLAGIFHLVPALSILSLVGLYSLYLIYAGLPPLMKAPKEKAPVYGIIAVIVFVMVWIVAGALAGALTPRAAI